MSAQVRPNARSGEVVVERDGRVVTITIDRPADQNRLTRDVLLASQGVVDVDEGMAAHREGRAPRFVGR